MWGELPRKKNLPAFLDLDLPGTKVVVGDGPDLEELRKQYPDAVFVGKKLGKELAEYYRGADVFVFPSKTDTFGNVQLEALASGVPVAAYPVTGPKDIITQPDIGVAIRMCRLLIIHLAANGSLTLAARLITL